MASRFADAAYAVMQQREKREMTSQELWEALDQVDPTLTEKTSRRKTPRTTMMRDLRKDARFLVGGGRITLCE